jgi:hypothetical protein
MPGRRVWSLFVLLLALPVAACQSPTSSTSTLDVDDIVDSVVTPTHAVAEPSTDGKTYRVVRGNNQPDDVLLFDWVTTFEITLTVNSNATDKDVDLTFPIAITSATGRVQQATGGIVTTPTGGDVEHYDSVLLASSGSQIAAVGGTVTLTFRVWYDLPNLRREALITESVVLQDADGRALTKTVNVVVDP